MGLAASEAAGVSASEYRRTTMAFRNNIYGIALLVVLASVAAEFFRHMMIAP